MAKHAAGAATELAPTYTTDWVHVQLRSVRLTNGPCFSVFFYFSLQYLFAIRVAHTSRQGKLNVGTPTRAIALFRLNKGGRVINKTGTAVFHKQLTKCMVTRGALTTVRPVIIIFGPSDPCLICPSVQSCWGNLQRPVTSAPPFVWCRPR